jgi:pimeloyl-ACP methyl ester carboxylesterase
LFKCQTEYFADSVAVDWIDPIANERLEEYAVRMAAMIRSKLSAGVESSDVVICGLSLGGMIAPYIARELNAAGYILLCSIRKPSEFPKRYYLDWLLMRCCVKLRVIRISFFRLFLRLFMPSPFFANNDKAVHIIHTPISWFTISPRISRSVIEQIISMSANKFAELSRMMFDWAYRKRKQDELQDNDDLNIPSIHIHGNRDKLLPIKLTNPDVVIEGGGHLLAMTHPDQVNKIIEDFSLKL